MADLMSVYTKVSFIQVPEIMKSVVERLTKDVKIPFGHKVRKEKVDAETNLPL